MEENLTAESIHGLLQTGWTMFAAALVLFMQAGFCCLEAGSVRHKNSINVALKNIVDLCASIAGYFLIGYAIMFGASINGWIGTPNWLLLDDGIDVGFFFFQATFAGTAATIVSGGIAERCRFLPYVLVAGIIGIFIYPVYGHWVWGGGWLSTWGFKDFAGSSVVHMVGAGVALAGIQILGPRAGRFGVDGRSRTIPASNMPMVAIGVIILTFGWIGFNGGSAALGNDTPLIIANTILAACFGGGAALLTTWATGGLARADLVLNGVLGGLVAVTAGADVVSLQSSAVIGVAGGISVIFGTMLLERLRLDDAVGAVPVHGVAGIVGIVLTAAFATPEALQGLNAVRAEAGLPLAERLDFVGIQAIGAVVCCAWAYGCGLIAWWLVGRITTLRIGKFEETVGMNYSEHAVANPADELAAAVNLASAGRRDEVDHRLDAADGELAGLAEAVRQLLDKTDTRVRVVRQFCTHMADVRQTLDDQRHVGSQQVKKALSEINDIDGRLDHLRTFLGSEEQLQQPGATAIILDLLTTVGQQFKVLQEVLPKSLQAWKEVDQAGGNLDRFLAKIGGLR